MKRYRYCMLVFLIAMCSTVLPYWAVTDSLSQNKPTLQVLPAKTMLSPALIKKPIQFKGSGFSPGEMVVVELEVPPKVKITGLDPKDKLLGISYTTADKEGKFQSAVAPTATLNWFMGVAWKPTMKPDLKKMSPLPPGTYKIRATGVDSEAFGTAELELLPPPKGKPKKR